ncbi:xanthine dehydrogenase family protein molybdopterin-binding subunit [Variovorax sp. LjRoot290]|uniref:xanthine dehydrogenase family protein molybdopterin-binding subunit n=1 Tax=Variovorax sp. LjRoot290 TaxID=3342316 RepID=UPI003ED06BAA
MTAQPGLPFGAPVARVDARAKVTGAARYAAEHPAKGLLYGVVVPSPIARGRIRSIDSRAARAVPGVIEVLTHENRPPMARFDLLHKDMDAPGGSPFRPLHDAQIHSDAQPVALVVAVSFEAARHAARLIEVHCAAERPRSDMQRLAIEARKPSRLKFGYQVAPKVRGEPEDAWDEAPVKIEARYRSPAEFHNPMETHASTAIWEGEGRLTIYDKTQGAQNSRAYLARVLKLRKRDVRVLCPFVGGAFGSGLRPGYQLVLAAMAALTLRRAVRVVLTRQQMFSFGHRPETLQTLKLACDTEGRLRSVVHEAVSETSRNEDYVENIVSWTGLLYNTPNLRLAHRVVELDRFTPTDMRAPGAAQGVYALESAMDELAHAVGLDPLALRLRNYTETEPGSGKPFSSKALRECYARGAERFGWSRREPEPRSMRDGRTLIGWGMATGVWDAMQIHGAARAVLRVDGTLEVGSATTDIGTGTGTVMSQIAAATLGLPLAKVDFSLGDSSLPLAPVQGGSFTVATIGTAVQAACLKIAAKLLLMARAQGDTPLRQPRLKDVEFVNGLVRLRVDPSRSISLRELMQRAGAAQIEAKSLALPNLMKQRKYARATHSAVFAEVRVDEDLGSVHVTRVVSAVAAGRIVNPRTATSQIEGGVVWGIGMALHEEGLVDHRLGRVMNHSLAEYHLAANADVGEIEVIFVDEQDEVVNPLGVKGVGEIGIVGVAAAVGNAIFHATGRRVYSLPITLDKVLGLD